MRGIDRAVTIVAGLLLAGIVASHGVHDLRGRASVESGHLRLEIDTGHSLDGNERCLRLLDELHVRDLRGRRLVGTARRDTGGTCCLLDYDLGESLDALTLQLRPSRSGMTANERVVLQPWRDGSTAGDVVVLSGAGNVERLVLRSDSGAR